MIRLIFQQKKCTFSTLHVRKSFERRFSTILSIMTPFLLPYGLSNMLLPVSHPYLETLAAVHLEKMTTCQSMHYFFLDICIIWILDSINNQRILS